MKLLNYSNETYLTGPRTISLPARIAPSLFFYWRFFGIVYTASRKAKRGVYDDAEWYNSSFQVVDCLERIGIRFQVTGIEHFQKVEGPCVVIGNHMSMMETVVLPIIIGSVKRLTFVIKESLLAYPVFKHIMRSRDPIAVSRTNPRQDLVKVMELGMERLEGGVSIIVFPQTTRAATFDPAQMSSIGVKLAKKAGVPIMPLALKTSAWKNGKIIKDLGKIDVPNDVHFAFDAPLTVQGKGTEEHQRIVDFIQNKLREWKETDTIPVR